MYTAAFIKQGGEIGRSVVRCRASNHRAWCIRAVSFAALVDCRRGRASDRRRDMRHCVLRHFVDGWCLLEALARRSLTKPGQDCSAWEMPCLSDDQAGPIRTTIARCKYSLHFEPAREEARFACETAFRAAT